VLGVIAVENVGDRATAYSRILAAFQKLWLPTETETTDGEVRGCEGA
jgi:hypothetical protein